jgi:two-component system, NarL family, nitrate/nitrite response regulator NarL
MSVVAKTTNIKSNGFATAIVVSDIMLFREGISAGLRQLGSVEIIGAYAPVDAISFVASACPRLVILDTSRRRALAQAAAIKQASPASCIIAFGIGSTEDALSGAESGIVAFVGEDGSVEDINAAAISALSGQSYCSPELTARLLSHIAQLAGSRTTANRSALTARENEIAGFIEQGFSNKEIAIELRISPATVKNHVHSILEKLALPRRSAVGRRHFGDAGTAAHIFA